MPTPAEEQRRRARRGCRRCGPRSGASRTAIDRHRQRAEAGLQRRVAADVLQVEGVEQQEARRARRTRDGDQRRAGERRAAEEAQVDQRLAAARLVDDERRRARPRRRRTARRLRRAPAACGALDDRVGERRQDDDHEHLADRVEPPRAAAPATPARTARSSTIAASADRHVDPEDRAPADGLRQRAADDRPERQADADDAAPDADRARALARVGEDVRDDRHRDRVEHRAADAPARAEGDQPAERRREAAQQRAER